MTKYDFHGAVNLLTNTLDGRVTVSKDGLTPEYFYFTWIKDLDEVYNYLALDKECEMEVHLDNTEEFMNAVYSPDSVSLMTKEEVDEMIMNLEEDSIGGTLMNIIKELDLEV